MARRKISAKERVSAVRDYVTSGDSLSKVSKRNGMSMETLRKYLGDKVRKRKARISSMKTMVTAKTNPQVPNACSRWKPEEDILLRDAVLGNFTIKEASDLLGRTRNAIATRKSVLMRNGFIQERRFVVPGGITRTRLSKKISPLIKTEEIVTPVSVATVEKTNPRQILDSVPMEIPSLRELASLVREFGVSVHMSVTQEGTTIKLQK